MLTLESLNSTRDLVAILADKGVALRPVAGSPLAEALVATKIWGQKIDCMTQIDQLPAELYQGNDCRIEDGEVVTSMHDAYMESATQLLGTTLAGHVAFATTVVLPAIHELHNKLKEVQDLELQGGARSWRVEMSPAVGLLDISSIANEVDKFSEIDPRREIPLNLDFKEISDEQIVGLMKVGAEQYDNAVDEFVAANGIDVVREAYNAVFAGGGGSFKHYDNFRSDREKGMARNFVTFLISSRLLLGTGEIPEATGVTGLSSNRRGMALKSLQEVSGASLYAAIEFKRQQEKQGKIVDKVDGKVVYVNKAVYDRYMTEGGDVEVILGAVVSGSKNVYVEDLVNNIEKYRLNWQTLSATAKQNAASDMLFNSRYAIVDFMRNYVRASDDAVIKSNMERIRTNVEEFVSHIYRPDLKDVDTLALRAVCTCLYNHTDAMGILRGVNEAMSQNPDISTADALNLSVLSYVADWFASQIEIG